MKTLNSRLLTQAASLTLLLASVCGGAFAGEQIVRPYLGVRSAGMGGVSLTTGFYEENFFGNPARVTANPKWLVTLPVNFTAETNSTLPDTISTLTSGFKVEDLGSLSGGVSHGRIQYTFPAFYIPFGENNRWGVAFANIVSIQLDATLRKTFELDPMAVVDAGPALTVGRKFLENDVLSVGLTTHVTYRFSTNSSLSFLDIIQGKKLDAESLAGQGAHLDFDLGATYTLPWKPADVEFTVAGTINNLLGGSYSNLGLQPIPDVTGLPRSQPRALGLGVSARYAEWKFLKDSVVAFELSDIGNNPNGSLFRWIHLGAETRLVGVFLPRIGFNQGYFSAGLGIDLKYVTLDLATYGEELTLNTGGREDRRYSFKLNFQI